MIETLLAEIVKRCRAGEPLVLCTVVATRGSTPQRKGARMLVLTSGETLGTLGGGCVEAEVRKRCLELLAKDESQLMEFRLDHDFGWDDGLICGGVMNIYAQVIDPKRDAGTWEEALDALRRQVPTMLRIPYEIGGESKEFTEEIGPPPVLVIAGAGHVGQALAELARKLDFRVTVIDDREDFASAERFPGAERRIVGEVDQELARLSIDAGTYVVIVTRGHRHDGQALRAVIDTPARYIGLIGSKSKIKIIYDDLTAAGVSPEALARVHAPIGYDIGAVSVPEIAVSIAAELIAARRKASDGPARQMRIATEDVIAWATRRAHA